MTRIHYSRNSWRNTLEAKCLYCGQTRTIRNHEMVGSVGKSWHHECNGKEVLGQEVKP